MKIADINIHTNVCFINYLWHGITVDTKLQLMRNSGRRAMTSQYVLFLEDPQRSQDAVFEQVHCYIIINNNNKKLIKKYGGIL